MEAPSFSSFPDLEPPDEPRVAKKEKKRTEKREEKISREKKKKKDIDPRRPGSSRRSPDTKPRTHWQPSAAELFIEEALRDIQIPSHAEESTPAAVKGLFLEDRLGDEENLRYGTLISLSRYSRYGRMLCIAVYARKLSALFSQVARFWASPVSGS